jgi:hypothetical protein
VKRNSPIDLVQQNGRDARLEIYSAAVVFTGQLRGGVVAGEWRRLGPAPGHPR